MNSKSEIALQLFVEARTEMLTDFQKEIIRKNLEEKVEQDKKLSELKSIEEELGIDLTIIFKALKKGWWYYDYIDKNVYCIPEGYKSLRFCGYGVCLECEIDEKMKLFPIKRYKQKYIGGWALTEEELKIEE